jgi:tRNA(His) guanylyltransferase
LKINSTTAQILSVTVAKQVDTHINNQYNTCFWALRQHGGKSAADAQKVLKGTLADFKNELLFSQFGINYNELPDQFKKGSVVIRVEKKHIVEGRTTASGEPVVRTKRVPTVLHVDIIKDAFWKDHPEILK